jgi:small-conductance mechanosensitive channel
MEFFNDLLEYEIFRFGDHSLRVLTIAYILITLILTKLLLWGIKKAFINGKRFDSFDQGNLFALFQIFTYLTWVLAITIILESIGVKMSVLLAGSAALMVGLGLGLQQTFNDIVSGIILLFEGSTKVGDLLEIDDDVIIIQTIGLRTSKGINRDDIVTIIPNSLITTNKVINWSHQSKKTRFHIHISVAYGSDLDLVERVLKESVIAHPQVNESDFIESRFVNFGASSLDFEILFFSQQSFRIEKVKSDIRKLVSKNFTANNITIPFQQVDLHLKSDTFGTNLPSQVENNQ